MSAAEAGPPINPSLADDGPALVVEIVREAIEHLEAGDHAAALRALAREQGLALANPIGQLQLGLALRSMGRRVDALSAFDATTQLVPDYPEGWFRMGECLVELERFEDALRSLDRATELDQDHVAALFLTSIALARTDRVEAGLLPLERALLCRPDMHEARKLRTELLGKLGRLEAALQMVESEAERRPEDAELWLEKSGILDGLDRLDEALDAVQRAIEIAPDSTAAHNTHGVLLIRAERYYDAMLAFTRVLVIDPEAGEAFNNQSQLFAQVHSYRLAMIAVEKAMKLLPNAPETFINRGLIHIGQGHYDEARSDCVRALELKPASSQAWNNLALVDAALHRFEGAFASFERAIQVQPDFAEARFNRGIVRLQLGDFRSGWRDYEARREMGKFKRRNDKRLDLPTWRGEPLAGKRLLVVQEQAFGDKIQFCRLLRRLPASPGQVDFWLASRLHRLLAPALPGHALFDARPAIEEYDYHVYMMSIPFVLGYDPIEHAEPEPYIAAAPGRVERWRKTIGADGFKVGICWAGSSDGDVARSIPLRLFEPLARIPGVRLVSLQKGAGSSQLDDLPHRMNVEILQEDLDNGPDGFLDTAAIVANLDLVITTDTSIAHLAGAMGHRTWVGLRFAPDWRWFLGRDDSPWYANVRLFRQPAPGDWASVVADMTAVLRSTAPDHQAGTTTGKRDALGLRSGADRRARRQDHHPADQGRAYP